MDFSLTDDQRELRERIVGIARDQLDDGVEARDAQGSFDHDAWKRCAEAGIPGLAVPEAYGGSDADPVTLMVALEALGYGCRDNGLLFALGAQMWSVQAPLVRFGTEDQKRRYLPGLCDGSVIGAHAMSEPESGSDAFAMTTTARADGDGYVLDGTKAYITNAPVADVMVVFATADPGRGFAAASAFVVDRHTPGIHVGPPTEKMGLRTALMGEVTFDGCRVSADALLGRAGLGLGIFNHSMEWERGYILAGAVGTMQRQLERCVERARSRRQFGRPIGSFQAVSHRLVDMAVRQRAGRLLLYEMAWRRAEGLPVAMEAAMAKLWVSESFLASSLDALFVHGASGYLSENGLERDVRDSVAGCIYSGTSDVQRNIVAGHLGL